MRVLVVHNAGTRDLPSGELAVVEDEVSALRKAGVQVDLHLVYNDPYIQGRFSWSWIFVGLSVLFSFRSFRQTLQLIRQYKPDVVHFHSILPLITPAAFLACKIKKIPTIQTLHNSRWICVEGGFFRQGRFCQDCLDKGSWSGIRHACAKGSSPVSAVLTLVNLVYWKTGLLFRWVDRFVAVSEFVKKTHVRAGFPEEKIFVNYNGIDLTGRKAPKEGEDKRAGVVFVGRLHPAKGTGILKEVIARSDRNLLFTIIGVGPDLDSLKSFCGDRGMNHVSFLGKVSKSEVMETLEKGACLIMPSQCGETFGRVAAEAMACGTPVVAARIGGIPEIVEKSGGGIAVAPERIEEYLDSLKGLMNSPERQKRMGESGRQFVKNQLSIELAVKKLLGIYEELVPSPLSRQIKR